MTAGGDFSANPKWDAIGCLLAEELFGKNWRRDVEWMERNDGGGISCGSSVLQWSMTYRDNICYETFEDGRCQNIDSKTPAYVEFFEDGSPASIGFYTNGVSNNPKPGAPAIEEYYPSGSIKSREFYTMGLENNPEEDIPAVTNYFENGGVEGYMLYRYGKRTDKSDGTPTFINYREDGSIAGGESSVNGLLSAKKTKAIVESIKNGKRKIFAKAAQLM